MNFTLFLRLGRISNLPTVWSNVIAGALLAGAALEPQSFILLCFAFSSFYVGGMFLNDAFDAEFDRQHRPERPIPSGLIERTTVYVMGGAFLLLGVLCVAAHGMLFEDALRLEPLLYAGALGVCIVWYNADHKKSALGPVLMGLNRVYVYATTAFVLTPEPQLLLWYGAAALLSYLIGLTYLAQQENRESVRSLWPLLFLTLPLAYPLVSVRWTDADPDWTVVGIITLALLVWIGRAVRLLRPKTGAPAIFSAITSLIAGISLLDALGAGLAHEPMWALSCVLAFALCLLAQKWVAGT